MAWLLELPVSTGWQTVLQAPTRQRIQEPDPDLIRNHDLNLSQISAQSCFEFENSLGLFFFPITL